MASERLDLRKLDPDLQNTEWLVLKNIYHRLETVIEVFGGTEDVEKREAVFRLCSEMECVDEVVEYAVAFPVIREIVDLLVVEENLNLVVDLRRALASAISHFGLKSPERVIVVDQMLGKALDGADPNQLSVILSVADIDDRECLGNVMHIIDSMPASARRFDIMTNVLTKDVGYECILRFSREAIDCLLQNRWRQEALIVLVKIVQKQDKYLQELITQCDFSAVVRSTFDDPCDVRQLLLLIGFCFGKECRIDGFDTGILLRAVNSSDNKLIWTGCWAVTNYIMATKRDGFDDATTDAILARMVSLLDGARYEIRLELATSILDIVCVGVDPVQLPHVLSGNLSVAFAKILELGPNIEDKLVNALDYVFGTSERDGWCDLLKEQWAQHIDSTSLECVPSVYDVCKRFMD